MPRYVTEDVLTKKFGKRVKKLRMQRGYTQETLAIEADVSVRSIKRIETGQIITSIAYAYRLAQGLGIPLSELFEMD